MDKSKQMKYIGVDMSGHQFIVPIQAKGGSDKLGISQIKQDLVLCNEKFPNLIWCCIIKLDTIITKK